MPPDVAAAEARRPINAIDCPIRTRLRLGYGLGTRRHTEHASAIGENLAVLRHRAGVEDFDAFDFRRFVEALGGRLDIKAVFAEGRRVALEGWDDPDG